MVYIMVGISKPMLFWHCFHRSRNDYWYEIKNRTFTYLQVEL